MKEDSNLVAANTYEIEAHTRTNEMIFNNKKSKVQLFNTSTKYDIQPELKVDSEVLEAARGHSNR